MEISERYRIVLDPIVSHDSEGSGETGPRLFNLFVRDRISNATLNAYLVGSKASVQAVVGRDEFLQFARLTKGADDLFGVLIDIALRDRGVHGITPFVTFVADLRPLKPPKPV